MNQPYQPYGHQDENRRTNRYPVAHLTTNTLDKLQSMENELRQVTKEEVILIAYVKTTQEGFVKTDEEIKASIEFCE